MKKIIIPFLIIINVLTLYFFVFPYQSFGDYNSLIEVDRTLRIQEQLIATSTENTIRDIKRNANAYPIFESKEKLAQQNHEIIREIRRDIEELDYAVYRAFQNYYNKREYGDYPPNDFWFRIQPFHYQAPKAALFKTDILAKATAAIDGSQKRILNNLNDEDFKQLLVDSFLIDTKALPQLLKGKSFMETMAIIDKLKVQNAIRENKIINHIFENMKNEIAVNQLQLKGYVPMVSVRNADIKKGELFEAEIFTTPIMTHDSLKFYINNQLVPTENGVANYEFTPTSSGTKHFHVAVELNNPIFIHGNEMYRRMFELYVADCE